MCERERERERERESGVEMLEEIRCLHVYMP